MKSNNNEEQGIGASVRRKEDNRHLYGKGQFVSDIILPGQREVAFLRSPVAHGYLKEIEKPVGFEDQVFTRNDLDEVKDIVAPSSLPTYKLSSQPPLAHGKVRFVGEPVAMCVAKSRAKAEDLSELVNLNIEEIPALVDADKAKNDNSFRVHDDWNDNLFLTLSVDNKFEKFSKKATVIVERKVELSRQAMVPMEGKAVLAYWDERADQLVIYYSTQTPHIIRTGISKFLNLDEAQVRIIAPDVGGGFGYKTLIHPEELSVAWLAMKFRKPFRWIEDRREHLISGANSRQHSYHLKAYADDTGRLLALDAEVTIDGGAYSNWPFTIGLEPGQATGNLPGPYDFQGYRCKTFCVATNKPGFLPYRGVARTGVCFAIERVMDALAGAVDRDPYDIRMDNLVRPEQMPYDNVTNKHYDSGNYPAALALAREKFNGDKWIERQRETEPDGRRIGIGYASYCEQSAHGTSVFSAWGLPLVPGYDQSAVKLTPDGGLEIRVGVQSHGQGMETTFAQLGHEVLGIKLDKIKVIHGDTGATPYSTGTYASRSIVMAGGATIKACQELIPRIINIGAHLIQCDKEDVKFDKSKGVIGPNGQFVELKEICSVWYLRPDRAPSDVDRKGLEVSLGYKPERDTGAFSYGSHAAAVAVDIETGGVEILDYVIVEDCGKMVNPLVVEGQTLGGVAQGIGTAMYEEISYDVNGQPNASTFADYLLPGPMEIPNLRIFHLETPSPCTMYGIKGMGEGGAIAPPAVIFNAVNNAIKDMGIEVNKTPLTPNRLLRELNEPKIKLKKKER